MTNPSEALKVYNILLMGQTGVGKSTFVNSIANYLTFETLTEALNENHPVCVINTKFNWTFRDKNNPYKNITVSMRGRNQNDDENEQFRDGESCTQQPRVYSFYCRDIQFNIIDVPGVDNINGVETDMINKQAIFQIIGQFKEIHGICVMLKEQTNRLGTQFKYCMNEIFSYLSRSAIDNIFFIVTSTSHSSFYPGQVSMPLKQYILQLNAEKNLNINYNNIFCIDNESFRFQIGWHESAEFRDCFKNKIDNYEGSWEESRNSVFNFLKKIYLTKPCKTEDLMVVAKASTVIDCIFEPLSEMSDLVEKVSTPEFKRQRINSLTSDDILTEVEAEEYYNSYKKSLKLEIAQFLESSKILTIFLIENAIIEYNKAFEERIKLEINIEEGRENKVLAKKLEKILESYRKKIKMMDKLKNEKFKNITMEQVDETLEKLFQHPSHGSKIKNLYQEKLPRSQPANMFNFIRLSVKYIPNISENLKNAI